MVEKTQFLTNRKSFKIIGKNWKTDTSTLENYDKNK